MSVAKLQKIQRCLNDFREQLHALRQDPGWWRVPHIEAAAVAFIETLSQNVEVPEVEDDALAPCPPVPLKRLGRRRKDALPTSRTEG